MDSWGGGGWRGQGGIWMEGRRGGDGHIWVETHELHSYYAPRQDSKYGTTIIIELKISSIPGHTCDDVAMHHIFT